MGFYTLGSIQKVVQMEDIFAPQKKTFKTMTFWILFERDTSDTRRNKLLQQWDI